jgi:hypothetical protein
MIGAKAWVTPPKRCMGGKRFLYLEFILRELQTDTGIKRVDMFTKKNYSNWINKNRCAFQDIELALVS